MAMDPDQVAKAFVDHYYRTFDTNRPALVGLYRQDSVLIFEGEKIQGPAAIAAKLGCAACNHEIMAVDCQDWPMGPGGGKYVLVSGTIRTDSNKIKFSQSFHLVPADNGSFFVVNDVFRMNRTVLRQMTYTE